MSDARLIDLETKAAYTEDMLAQLNDVIVRQERRIEHLESQLRQLTRLLENPQPESGEEPPPPHY